jgi:hypothetical protein
MGNMKDRFKSKDWDRLLRLPCLMFQFVALADRQLQPEEAGMFAGEVQDALRYKDPLHRALFTDLSNTETFKVVFGEATRITSDSVGAIEKEFQADKKILKKKLKDDEYNRFFVSLMGTGLKVAGAAGDGVANVSTEETAALAVFMTKFEVDIEAGRAALGKI